MDYDALVVHPGSPNRDDIAAVLMFPGDTYRANTKGVIEVAKKYPNILIADFTPRIVPPNAHVEDNHRGGLTAAEAVLRYLDAKGIPVSPFVRDYITKFVAPADVGLPYERDWLPRGVDVKVEEKNLMAKLTAPLHYCEGPLCKTDFGLMGATA